MSNKRLEKVREMIGNLLFDGKRGEKCLVKNIGMFLHKRGWDDLPNDVFEITAWMPDKFTLIQRMYCIYSGINEFPRCPHCGGGIEKMRQHFSQGFNKYCCQKCSRAETNPLTGKTADEVALMHKKIGAHRLGTTLPEEWKSRLSEAASKSVVKEKKMATCKCRYGVSNPGVLGAYCSASATRFICDFLKENKIEEDRAYYKGGGVNKSEFFQNIDGKYVSYDLVVFKNAEAARCKDMGQIDLVLEYNGPWHYLEIEAESVGEKPASPYPKSKTIREVIDFDKKKMNHMLRFTPDYRIVWQKDGILRRMGSIPEGIIVVN